VWPAVSGNWSRKASTWGVDNTVYAAIPGRSCLLLLLLFSAMEQNGQQSSVSSDMRLSMPEVIVEEVPADRSSLRNLLDVADCGVDRRRFSVVVVVLFLA
jgi:hypothetical protein